jgi:hypothetical protein
MKSVLCLNIPLKNALDALHRKLGLNQTSSFKFAPFLKKKFRPWMWIFHWGTRNVCITTGIISSICYNLSGFCLWLFGLWVCRMCCGSSHTQKELIQETCHFPWSGQVICRRLSHNLPVTCFQLQKNAVRKYWNEYDLNLLLTSSRLPTSQLNWNLLLDYKLTLHKNEHQQHKIYRAGWMSVQ